jgi:carboxyl-terminal processing protease
MPKTSYVIAGAALGAALTLTATQVLPQALSRNAAPPTADTYRQLNLFGDVFDRVRTDYVERPDESKLIEAAINGMLTSLDPHSAYLPPRAFRDMQVQTRGEFGGLGIEVTMENGVVRVVTPIDETPAARGGVRAGDIITHLDGESIQGFTLQQAVERMRGVVGSAIQLRIQRQGADDPVEIRLTRDTIRIRSVRARDEGGDIGYVRITQFTEQTMEGLRAALEGFERTMGANLRGIVVDMRNNPGGLLDQSIQVSDAFLERGEIVSTRGRGTQDTQRFSARSGDMTRGKPIVVLINGGSASASEIVAGALQDHRRATVVGTRSFGKGSVQTIIPMGANGAIRLTTSRYYTPSGRSIQARGIDPDINIVNDEPEATRTAQQREQRSESQLRGHLRNDNSGEERGAGSSYIPPDAKDDKQLNYAFDLIRGRVQNAAFPPNPRQGVPN